MTLINSRISFGFSKKLPQKSAQRFFLGAEQVHGSLIKTIHSDQITSSRVFDSCDGVVYKQEKTFKKVCLYVKTADCLPLLIYSPKNKLLGAVHVGYKSAYLGILTNLVNLLTSLKVDFQELSVVFGPSINGACYNIPMSRYKRFQDKFENSSSFLFTNAKNYYLSLAGFAHSQLISLNVPKTAFSWQLYCTHCQADKYYSFRRGDRNVNFYSYLTYD